MFSINLLSCSVFIDLISLSVSKAILYITETGVRSLFILPRSYLWTVALNLTLKEPQKCFQRWIGRLDLSFNIIIVNRIISSWNEFNKLIADVTKWVIPFTHHESNFKWFISSIVIASFNLSFLLVLISKNLITLLKHS